MLKLKELARTVGDAVTPDMMAGHYVTRVVIKKDYSALLRLEQLLSGEHAKDIALGALTKVHNLPPQAGDMGREKRAYHLRYELSQVSEGVTIPQMKAERYSHRNRVVVYLGNPENCTL